jgi:hypothetical protein
MRESLVALCASLVQGLAGKIQIGGDQVLNGLPLPAVTVPAGESLVDLGDRGRRMDLMRAEPYVVCDPTQREDQGEDQGDE